MSSELATLPDSALDLRQRVSAARAAGIIPQNVRTDDAAIGIILKARELGVPEMQAFSQIHVINGVPSCSSQLMLGLAYKRLPEFAFEIKHSDGKSCTARMRRDSGRTWIELTYTIEQARAAGITNKPNWKNHPDDMLRNRIVSKLLKMVAPDTFAGLYTPDEAEEIAPRPVPHEVVGAQAMTALLTDPAAVGAEPVPEEAPESAEDAAEAVRRAEACEMAEAEWREAIEQCDTKDLLRTHATAIAAEDRIDDDARSRLGDAIRAKAAAMGWTRKGREPGED